MKVAIIGSRNLVIEDVGMFLPKNTTEIVSGGAKGIDTCAKEYALQTGLMLTEILPDYHRYKRGAPLKRNEQIVEYADFVLAFWDGVSKGTKFVIDTCHKTDKPIRVEIIPCGKIAN